MAIILRKKDGAVRGLASQDPPPPPLKFPPVLVDDGRSVRELVDHARMLINPHTAAGLIIKEMADKLEWLGKSYGLWRHNGPGQISGIERRE
jgi:hypothetical protein